MTLAALFALVALLIGLSVLGIMVSIIAIVRMCISRHADEPYQEALAHAVDGDTDHGENLALNMELNEEMDTY